MSEEHPKTEDHIFMCTECKQKRADALDELTKMNEEYGLYEEENLTKK